jgi:hypothetical protein
MEDVQLTNLMNMAQRAAANAGAPQELFMVGPEG